MFGQSSGKSPREFVLAWVREKLPHRNIVNLGSDWTDGVALCELVNTFQPGLIPSKLYADKRDREGNAQLGIQIAHDAFGIPQLISSSDLAASLVDELSLVTYIALFCKYESLMSGGKKPVRAPNTELEARENKRGCQAYGAGLKCSELGKVAEFVVELNGAKSADITIAIEYKPTGSREGPEHEKPELSVKPLGRETYSVKYLPTRPGEYVISILHSGEHILRSPFYLTVKEPNAVNFANHSTPLREAAHANGKERRHVGGNFNLPLSRPQRRERNSSYSDGSTSSSEDDPLCSRSSPASYSKRDDPSASLSGEARNKAEGPGLVAGEVGRVGKFTVSTDNSTKGPLSVCISCPAVSIPVPYVKSEKRDQHTVHRVYYIPTEPGTYEIYVKWGETSIVGSPFKAFINDVTTNDVTTDDVSELGGKGKLRLYYAATAINPRVRRDKELLDEFLKAKGICDRPEFEPWVALDVGMCASERERIFKRAGTRKTPMVFLNDQYIGGYEDIIIMDKQGLFDPYYLK